MVNVVRLRLSVLYTPIEKLWNALNVDMRSIQQFNDFKVVEVEVFSIKTPIMHISEFLLFSSRVTS